MGNPGDDPDMRARATADAELARQDKVATELLDLSATNLESMSSTMADQGYGDAAAVLHRAASQQLHEGVRHALQGEYYHDASVAWGGSATSLGEQASQLDQSYAVVAERRQVQGELLQPNLSDADRANAKGAEADLNSRITAHVDAAFVDGRVAERLAEQAIEAEEQAHKIHPEVADDGAVPEPPVAE